MAANPAQTKVLNSDPIKVQDKIESGLAQLYELAKASYGPSAGVAILEQHIGNPLMSRDGVTNMRKFFVEDPEENQIVKIAKQASEKNDIRAGDGTTAAVILTYHLYKAARQLMAGGHNRMVVAKKLQDVAVEVVKQIDAIKKPADDKLLKDVAIISASDRTLGELIIDVTQKAGIDGGITVNDFLGTGSYGELIEGFYFEKGFTSIHLANDPANLESKHTDVPILITSKPMITAPDIAPILDKIVRGGMRELVIIGDVRNEALEILMLNRMKGIVTAVPADMPVSDAMKSLWMDDLAIITGARVWTGGENKDFDLEMLGAAEKVIITPQTTTIFGRDGAKEDIEHRINELKAQLKTATSAVDIEAIKTRLAKLTGRIGIIHVGGATEVEQQEVKLRARDAVDAVQAAIKDGVCPGGGVTLARVKTSEFESAFKEPFRQLMSNAGLNTDGNLFKIEKAPKWHGFDIRNMTDQPINLLEAGIVDPALVLKEVVRNATSVVSQLITATSIVTFKDRDAVYD